MLSRVSAALAKNLAPLSASPPKTSRKEKDAGAFHKYEHQKKQEKPSKPEEPSPAARQPEVAAPSQATPQLAKAQLRVIKTVPNPWEGDGREEPEAAPAEVERARTVGTAEVFLQLFQFINQRKTQLMRWLGFRSYKDISANGMSGGKKGKRRGVMLRKGTMIDHKAE